MQTLVIIPTYNERENIKSLISQILGLNLDIDILVVDDSSCDGTAEILDEISSKETRVSIIHRSGKRGRGLGGIDGMRWALKRSFDYIIEMDGDFSHQPKYIPVFLDEIRDCDVIIGSRRVCNGGAVGINLQRRFLSCFGQYLSRLVLGLDILDATSGFRCFRQRALKGIDLGKLKSQGPAIIEETNFYFQKNGFKIKEVPIIYTPRQGGVSKLNLIKAFNVFWTLLKIRFTG
ncbi:MAG: polyprenol monophosphomannose synthase [Candidatus Omnitrophota bacterium]